MPSWTLGRGWLIALAALYAAASLAYSAVWMYAVRHPAPFLGVEIEHMSGEPGFVVRVVRDGTPAAAAGLRTGDHIRDVDGQPAGDPGLGSLWQGRRPGEHVLLGVARDGQRLVLDAVLASPPQAEIPLPRLIANELLGIYPVPFLAVGVAVLLLRLEDRHAWMVAVLFAGLIAGAPLLDFEAAIPRALRRPAFAYKVAFNGATPAVFLYLFSVFPSRWPVDRRWPALKSVWLVLGAGGSLALAAVVAVTGDLRAMALWADRLWATPVAAALAAYTLGGILLGFAALIWNAVRGDTVARRKSRVIVWGTVLGFAPGLLLSLVGVWTHRQVYQFPFWVWAPCILAMFLMPLSFGYAVVRQRVLGVPTLLRRSARYLLVQRGSLGLFFVAGVGITLLFATVLAPLLQSRGPSLPPAVAVGMGAAFGTLVVWTGSQAHRRVRERIDRAFFRRSYDARALLHDLAERAGAAQSREELAALLEHHLRGALLPRSLWLYLESSRGALEPIRGAAVVDALPVVAELARQGQPQEVRLSAIADPAARAALVALDADCVVPIPGRQRRLIGVLVLGPRLSEDPYSGEDKRLMATVAVQAGIALESIHLGEQVAARLEVERRAAHEMELAQQVQARLLPQEAPPLATLEYGGRCLQARAVGGDYYDFLDLGPGRVGLALADVSGKGFPAALLMANLQASLRSRSPQDMLDLACQLRSMNHLLDRCSEPNRYATLFLGIYDDSTRRLRYANCGHNPPVLLRRGGALERLLPTAMVLGLLPDWDCTTEEVCLEAGDVLAVFSDGVTEAFSDGGEEFGEDRLVDALRRRRDLPVPEVLDGVVSQVREFSGSEQEDDLTLVIARARG